MKTSLFNINNTRLRGYFALVIGVLALSLSPIIVKTGEAHTVVTSFYRMFFTCCFWTVVILVKAIKNPEKNELSDAKPNLKWLIFPAIAGCSSGIDHGLWAVAMNKTSVTNTTILNGMAPIWISLFALIFLHEKFDSKFWFGLFLAIVGMIFMSGKGFSFFKEGMNAGDAIALFSSMFYGGYYFFTQLGRSKFGTLFQMWASIAFCSATLFVFCKIMGLPLTGYSRNAWISILLVTVICQIIGYFFITYALGCLPASIVGPSNEMHSVLSVILAYLVLGEAISKGQIIGCIAITMGIFLINQSKNQPSAED